MPAPTSPQPQSAASSLIHAVDAVTRSVVAGRPVVILGGNVPDLADFVPEYRALGAGPMLLLGTRCSGPVEPQLNCDTYTPAGWVVCNRQEELRARQSLIDQPPADVVATLDRFDPLHEAVVVILSPMIGDAFCDREVFGGRPRRFGALEDKTVCDGIWEAADIPHAPARILSVTSTESDFAQACAEVESRHGTVWGMDATHGMRGGGEAVWWLPPTSETSTPELIARRVNSARAISRRVRVMPFLAGVPCSIHGLVLPDGVAVSRPTEMVVLHDPRPDRDERFVFAGTSMLWDPPAPMRRAMVDAARRVGAYLRETHGFRGFFGIDGVATASGFVPHELNPRFTAGLWQGVWGTGLPLFRAHCAALRGESLELRCDDVESIMVAAFDQRRPAACGFRCDEVPWEGAPHHFALAPTPNHGWGRAQDKPQLIITLGAAPTGGTRVVADLRGFPVGKAVAPALSAALQFLGAELGLTWPRWTTSEPGDLSAVEG